eukprot:3237833-Pyramimonas_sp.AAC.1
MRSSLALAPLDFASSLQPRTHSSSRSFSVSCRCPSASPSPPPPPSPPPSQPPCRVLNARLRGRLSSRHVQSRLGAACPRIWGLGWKACPASD